MLTDESIIRISNLIIGDESDLYSYMAGSQIVKFFNNYFGYNDKYGQGFPSRWAFTNDKIIDLFNKGKTSLFLNTILSKQFLMKNKGITESQAIILIPDIVAKINDIIKSDSMILIEKNGSYNIIKLDNDLQSIGHGGYADVYFQKSTGLVIKKLKEDCVRDKGIRSRFKREYKITKSLEDTGMVIKVYEFNEEDYSYTMEQAEQTFEDYVMNGNLDEATKIKCIRLILNTMKDVHNRGIIHRDLSPNNIFVIGGRIVLADFGLGKDLNVFASHQTMHTNTVGQYFYCAPEQFMLLKDSDKQSDVFSLGRIINFIMTRKPTDDNHKFRTIIKKATNETPAIRYGDAGELLKAFEKSIEYQQRDSRDKEIKNKIISGVFDDEIEEYIYEQDAENLCKLAILNPIKIVPIYTKFMQIDEKHAEHIIFAIQSAYESVCKIWDDYDVFANISEAIINGKYDFLVREIAARVLHEIAFGKNRFNAQYIINSIIDSGVEPSIEDILQ